MSKVATYLQEHILGEVSTNGAVLAALSHDLSVLEMTPEMVVYPRATNDIRKVMRFTWQLAEKGHVLPVTVRGGGTDETGGAIGKGVIISTTAHMNRIFEFDAKQKLVRLQPGTPIAVVNAALSMQGMGIASLPAPLGNNTVGGAVAKNLNGPLAAKYGDLANAVSQLEVILANGDVLQTERLSKRELNKKKGMQTFEGEIYRSLDTLLDDNAQLIADKVSWDVRDSVGYTALAKVKQTDGSFDLTPLFLGSQGTLGIISEMIMKTDFVSESLGVAAMAFPTSEAARDALDQLDSLEPAFVEYYDAELFTLTAERGKRYKLLQNAGELTGAVVLIGFDDFSDHARIKKLKKVQKMLGKATDVYCEVAEGDDAAELLAIREATYFAIVPDGKVTSAPPVIDGAYIPRERSEEFLTAAKELANKYGITMPFHNRVLESTFYARPQLQLHKVGDKQKVFKLIEEYANLVDYFQGHLIGNGSEGRVKALFAYKHLDPEVIALFDAVRAIFDPHSTLNAGVKQSNEVRVLVSHLVASYDTGSVAGFAPYN